jgi:WXG100 family type VII secretion target
MPEGYTGTVTDFTNAHQKVLSVKQDVDGTLKNVRNEVAGLQGQWAGQAATAFTAMMNRFDGDAVKLNQALEAIAEQLQAAGSTYEQQEQSKHEAFGNISSQLGG